MEIVVVTKVPEDGTSGNMALAGELFWATQERSELGLNKVRPLLDVMIEMLGDRQQAGGFWLNLRQPVFHVGEVLILDGSGREIGYPGRKPSKWFVETETVASLEEAHRRAQEVM